MNSKDTIEKIDTVAVSSKVLADIIGVSDRRIRQLADEGIIVRSRQGRYILKDSIRNYIVNLKVENSAKQQEHKRNLDEVEDLATEKAKHEHTKRQISELRLALMKGKMYEEADVEMVLTDMLVTFKQKLLSLPAKLSARLENRDRAYINTTLTDEMNVVLMDLANYNPEDFKSDKYIDIEDEVDED